jgi:CPA2 family monovalent cation:H+ antiporter-2
MHATFLIDLALVLCVAAVTTALFQRLHQPVVLGYLLAGAIVSPHTPLPLFADEQTIHALAELGVILLMFSLGLEFSLRKLWRVAPTAGVVAIIQCSLMVWLGFLTGELLGWTALESLYTGALIAISSTTIIVKAFDEQGVGGGLTEIVFGILIVEDLIAILLLAILTTVSAGASLTAEGVAATAVSLAAFLAIAVGGGLLVIPPLMRAVVRLQRPETTVVTSVGVCFAFALCANAVGYSVALGAFLAGAVVAESGEVEIIKHLVQPVRDIFAAIFFVAVGMLINPALIADHWLAVLVLTTVVVLGKLVGVGIGVFLTGGGIRTSIQAGMSLAQIGEFSFIIAALGLSSGATGPFLYPLAITVSAITTLLTPWLIRASDPIATYIDRCLPRPVQTFVALYGTWLEQLRSRPREPSVGRRVRQLGRALLLDAALLAAIIIATAVWGPRLAEIIEAHTPLIGRFAWLAVIAAAAALAAPFCIGIKRCTAALAYVLATAALPLMSERADLADAPRRALIVTLEMAVLLLVGAPLIALTQPFLPALPGPIVLAAIISLLALALWRSAANLQEHTRAGAQAIVEALARQLSGRLAATETASVDLQQLDRILPGLGTPQPIRIRAGTHGVGKTLAQLNLRGLTGATVLAIIRERDQVLVPSGRETLRAGDLLAVAGTSEAIRSADQLLERVDADPGLSGDPAQAARSGERP